jgi:DNA-binding FrmR family transcriptional regulator
MEATRGYSATKDQLLKRLARVGGQVRGLERMVDEDRYCIDVLTQVAAVQAALDGISLGLLDGHVRHCMQGERETPEDPAGQAEELMGAVGRLVRR